VYKGSRNKRKLIIYFVIITTKCRKEILFLNSEHYFRKKDACQNIKQLIPRNIYDVVRVIKSRGM